MFDPDKIKPGDPFVFDGPIKGMETQNFLADDPPFDKVAQVFQFRQQGTHGTMKIHHDYFMQMVKRYNSCTCDLRGPNMWFGCRCGFAERERAEKEKA